MFSHRRNNAKKSGNQPVICQSGDRVYKKILDWVGGGTTANCSNLPVKPLADMLACD